MAGIIDEPLPVNGEDRLDIGRYAKSLTTFITASETPITIGVQGEWGSGKTSLLNQIYGALQEDRYKKIWVNSWEHSLMSSPEETLLKITNEIIGELLASDPDVQRAKRIKDGTAAIFKGALRVSAGMAAGIKGSQVVEELIGQSINSIRELRKSLADLSDEIRRRRTNPYEKIVVFVDDLDRIEPKDAVRILELLKNIFNVKGCVFVLAIDYQVIVKGLKDKFGDRNPDNEWEFRAFFDKIIQLPFMMPMGQYNIGKYVDDLMIGISFSGEKEMSPEHISKIISYSIGGNPRSIKRLINSLELIRIFTTIDIPKSTASQIYDAKVSEKYALLVLVCIQIAYPKIYELLTEEPDFENWDVDLAASKTQKKEEDDPNFLANFAAIQSLEEFDEPWEQCLYRICYSDIRQRAKASEASKLLNYLKSDMKNVLDDVAGVFSNTIEKTAVTSVTSTDKPIFKSAKWKSAEEKELSNELWNKILDELQDKTDIFRRGGRKGSSGVIRLKDKSTGKHVQFCMGQSPPRLYLYIFSESSEESLEIMNSLMAKKQEIESEIGQNLEWEKTEKRSQKITLTMKDTEDRDLGDIQYIEDKSNWNEILSFFTEFAPKFESVMHRNLTERNQ